MIRIESGQTGDSKKEVKITISGTGAVRKTEFYFRQELSCETHAQLLVESLWRGVSARLEEIKRDAYQAGYEAGRGHKFRQTHFFGDFDADVGKCQRQL